MAQTLHRFRTGLCSTGPVDTDLSYWPSLVAPSFKIQFRPLHREDPTIGADSLKAPGRFQAYLRPPEINILAASQEKADVAALLLYAAHALIDASIPTAFTGWDAYVAWPVRKPAPSHVGNSGPRRAPFRMQFAGAADVAGLAVRLARRRSLTDAAFYFLASVYSVSSTPIQLHPRYGEEKPERVTNPMHRVWEAQSIFAAFQAIEALDLTVKGASASRPSIINGVWQPEIRSNLETRLERIGVMPSETILWLRRGNDSTIQQLLSTRTSKSLPTSWVKGKVRDEKIPYVDAINRAQWLRSNVSAHRSHSRLKSLQALDALNVQHLARMLVMNAAGFPWWNKRKGSRE